MCIRAVLGVVTMCVLHSHVYDWYVFPVVQLIYFGDMSSTSAKPFSGVPDYPRCFTRLARLVTLLKIRGGVWEARYTIHMDL